MTDEIKECLFKQWAEYVNQTYGTQYDTEEMFFVCPDCGEPLYLCDMNTDDFFYNGICPVCGVYFDENGNDEDEEYDRGSYSPSAPWNAPGMSVKDFL